MIHPLQWSVKLDNGEIYVAQADTVEELILLRDEMRAKALNQHATQPVTQPLPTTSYAQSAPAPIQPGLICQVCGGKAEVKEGTSKAGNAYKIFRCLNNPELQKNGGHSHFVR